MPYSQSLHFVTIGNKISTDRPNSSIGMKRETISCYSFNKTMSLAVDYLVIKPMTKQLCDMSVSYARHWKHKRRALDVGHRGMGTSHCDPAKK